MKGVFVNRKVISSVCHVLESSMIPENCKRNFRRIGVECGILMTKDHVKFNDTHKRPLSSMLDTYGFFSWILESLLYSFLTYNGNAAVQKNLILESNSPALFKRVLCRRLLPTLPQTEQQVLHHLRCLCVI